MKLAAYLKHASVTPAAFARDVGVSKQTMFKYVHGLCFPSPQVVQIIREKTGGLVTADDLVDHAADVRSGRAASPAEAA